MLFIDDLSMPLPEKYGAQPPIELLRQWIDHAHLYDLVLMSRIDLFDIVKLKNYYRIFILVTSFTFWVLVVYWRSSTSWWWFK